MPRAKGYKDDLEAAVKQLDDYIASGGTKPGVLNGLTKKIEVYQRLHERFLDQRSENLQSQLTEARAQLAKFDGVNPNEIISLRSELTTLQNQNTTLRSSNASLMAERDTARQEVTSFTASLKWMCGRATPDRRLHIATCAFIEIGRDSRPIVDTLLSTGTYAEWEKLAASKQRLIETYRQHLRATNADDIGLREFAKQCLKDKHSCDVEKLLAEQAEEARKTSANEDAKYRQQEQQRAEAQERRRMDYAQEMLIRQAEDRTGPYAPVPVVPRHDLEW